jgi:replication fork protection complex subunit Csm3/Swi3
MSESGADSDGQAPSSDASRPPPSSPDRDEADIELDALLEEEKAQRATGHIEPTSYTWKKSHTTSSGDVAMDEGDDVWDVIGMDAPASASVTAPRPPPADEDEEMWDIVRELEQEQQKDTAHPSNTASETPGTVYTQEDDLEDLYL